MARYTHRVVVFHTIRKGTLAGITVPCTFGVCCEADGHKAVADLRRGLDVVEARVEPIQ